MGTTNRYSPLSLSAIVHSEGLANTSMDFQGKEMNGVWELCANGVG